MGKCCLFLCLAPENSLAEVLLWGLWYSQELLISGLELEAGNDRPSYEDGELEIEADQKYNIMNIFHNYKSQQLSVSVSSGIS